MKLLQKNAYGGERKLSKICTEIQCTQKQLVRILEEILYPEVDGDILIRQRVFVVCGCLFLCFSLSCSIHHECFERFRLQKRRRRR